MTIRKFAVFLVGHVGGQTRILTNLLRGAGYKAIVYSSVATFLRRHDPFASGCAVLDLSPPAFDGLEIQQKLLRHDGIERPVIFLTDDAPVPVTVKAMRAGAIDVLLKPVDPSTFLDAITRAQDRDAANGRTITEHRSVGALVQKLTPREREVMAHVAAGDRNKEVAAKLGISVKTVKVHRGNVMHKMRASSFAHLVRMVSHLPPTKLIRSSNCDVRAVANAYSAGLSLHG